MVPKKINIVRAVDCQIAAVLDPHIVGDVNESQVKVARFGETFDWHSQVAGDEAFLVLHS